MLKTGHEHSQMNYTIKARIIYPDNDYIAAMRAFHYQTSGFKELMDKVNMKPDDPTVSRPFPEHDIWLGLVFFDDGAILLAENKTVNQRYNSIFTIEKRGITLKSGPDINFSDNTSMIELAPGEIAVWRFELTDDLSG
jgi:hypothetical protein